MTAIRLDGKIVASRIRQEILQQVMQRKEAGLSTPGLAAVLVGADAASRVYVQHKRNACEEVGMRSWLFELPEETSRSKLLELIEELNANPDIHGILVQLPLPRHIDPDSIISALDETIDVDAFHPENVGRLAVGHPRFYPCTPQGVVELMHHYQISSEGKSVVIVGRSNIVGMPLGLMLMRKRTDDNPLAGNATVTYAHTATQNLAAVCRGADILIAAVGVPNMITPEMVKPGAVVIDVGINRQENKLVGDVDPAVAAIASAMTPVPGGVGPMTIAMLLRNTLKAAIMLDG